MPYFVKLFHEPMNIDESRILNQKIIEIDSSAKLVIHPDRPGFAPCWLERPDDGMNDTISQVLTSQRLIDIVEKFFAERRSG